MRTQILHPPRDGSYSVRVYWAGCTNKSGCQTWGGFATEAEAKAAATLLTGAIERGDSQLLDALRKRAVDRVGDLLTSYLTAGAPDRHGRPRAPGALAERRRHIEGPLQWFADYSTSALDDRAREDYLAHRRTSVVRGSGERTTELELGTLNDALHWAWRRGDLKELPRSMRSTFRRPEDIAHARDAMPSNADELHTIADWLFRHDAPVYGWLTLFKAFTGLRDEECQLLQFKPQRHGLDYPPGFADAQFLRIQRVKRGRNPRVALDDPQRPEIAPLLAHIHAWRKTVEMAATPHSVPLSASGGEGLGEVARLFPAAPEHTKAIQRAAAALKLGRRTGHALRAYYATTRLAQGVSPELVAVELGQQSGDELVRDVYGANPDDFDLTHFTSLADRFRWLPVNRQPAWTWWTDQQTTTPSNVVAL